MVRVLSTVSKLDGEIRRLGTAGIAFIDFYADWCPPCRMIAPMYEDLSRRFPSISFYKVNVDHSRDIAGRYSITAMPTFVVLKGGVEVERIKGADANRLTQLADQYSKVANPNAASHEERAFLEQFTRQSDRYSKYYDNIMFQTLGRSVIPPEISDLADKELNLEVAVRLMHWFKNDFFRWQDVPECNRCGKIPSKSTSLSGTPTKEEKEYGADRVEVYSCPCGGEARFPRYNDPGKLLETRKGRCGEWANCFTLLASSLGFPTRFIYDTTDHVWTEIHLKGRWMHFDSCENTFDKPLLYEVGWKKKLSYVVAFGKDDVADVTWKYVRDVKETMKRRNQVRPSLLSSFLEKLSNRLLANCALTEAPDWSTKREGELKKERLVDLIESIRIGKVDDSSYGGRESGSEEWRLKRGEIEKANGQETNTSYTIKASKLQDNKFIVEYDVVRDVYTIGGEERIGWNSCVKEVQGIQRKVENDWRMAYLCREEEVDEGWIEWDIDLNGLSMSKLEVSMGDVIEREGSCVQVTLCVGDMCMMVKNGKTLELPGPFDSSSIHIRASFRGGSDRLSFQHSQICRASLDDPKAPHFSLVIHFN